MQVIKFITSSVTYYCYTICGHDRGKLLQLEKSLKID